MNKLPTDDEIEIALMWLESNEGEGIECDACRAVAHWLAEQKFERLVKYQARKHGLPIARVRQKLRQVRGET